MPTKVTRPAVLIPDNIAMAFRARVAVNYPEIQGISDVPMSRLIRFIVLVTAGVPVSEAQKGLGTFTNQGVNFSDPPGN